MNEAAAPIAISETMDIPATLLARLGIHAHEPVGLGESGAGVWRCMLSDGTTTYLKAAALADGLQLEGEAERLRWMKARGLVVPGVRETGCVEGTEFLLLDEVRGHPASDHHWSSRTADVVAVLGKSLAMLHRTGTDGCPFDQRVAGQIEEARRRVAAGRVREDDFDDSRAGRTAAELFAELSAAIPRDEDLVFTHGDFCLPNVILDEEPNGAVRVGGFIDCGRAGVADRHQDLALAVRSIESNLGPGWAASFLAAYGTDAPRTDKLSFYMLLDEFF